jgi:putative Mn2+ efflux pump MntP
MGLLSLILIGIGLSFDTFAVSVSTGLIVDKISFRQAIRFALILALFQSMMPAIGWVTGTTLKDSVVAFDHWIAFILLSILGLKMIYDSMAFDTDNNRPNPLRFSVATGIGLATSIDALVVGFSFGLLEVQIITAVVIIGGITFLAAMLGMLFGKKIGMRFGKKMEILGGLVLIGLGTKILLEHLFFN